METRPEADQTVEGVLKSGGFHAEAIAPGNPHIGGRACRCDKCEAKRAKWRARDLRRRQKQDPTAGVRSGEDVGSPLPGISDLAGLVPPPLPPKPVVPWTVELVRPLVAKTADLVEKWDGETIMAEARKISSRVADFVASRVAWNGEAKGMLVDGGAECAVKYLNEANISAEYAPEIKFGLAALSILYSRQSLIAELKKMQDEAKTANAAKEPEKKAA